MQKAQILKQGYKARNRETFISPSISFTSNITPDQHGQPKTSQIHNIF